MKILIIFIIYSLSFIRAKDEVSVDIKSEKFVGFKQTVLGKELNVFLGIPYAEPPVGDLRFRKPKPYRSAGNAINAQKWPNNCIQNPLMVSMASGLSKLNNKNVSEDCLYLNIWAHKKSGLKPVMVWIHGGGMTLGSSSQDAYSGEMIAAFGDVVVVTINYRLQALGFLYTGTDDAPGNAGLWDQALALQWVQNNIQRFGGDPDQVTIFGESAGSWSVSLHLLSPVSRGLYKNAIMMSGSALNHVINEKPNRSLQLWLKVAKAAKCGNGLKFTEADMKCLRKIPAQELRQLSENKELNSEIFGFLPTVRYGDEFLPKSSIEMLKSGDFKKNVSLLAGFTNDEGSLFLNSFVDRVKYSPENPINLTKSEAIELLANYSSRIHSDIPINGEDVSRVYMSRLPANDPHLYLRTIGIALGDFYLGCPTKQFAKAIYSGDETNNRVFQYYFTAKPKVSLVPCGQWQGSCHGTDILPALGVPLRYPNLFDPKDISLSRRMLTTFTHFARHGTVPAQDGVNWLSYYTVSGKVVQQYYEWSLVAKEATNFGIGLKEVECEKLWKLYIDRQ